MTWRYWSFSPPHLRAWQTIEWVVGDEEGPSSDRPTRSNAKELLLLEATGQWSCAGIWWRPATTSAQSVYDTQSGTAGSLRR
jgi:hypothetical protein